LTTIKYSKKWEGVGNDESRLKTPLGWIFFVAAADCMVFVPDPDHLWVFEETKSEKKN